MGNIFLKGSNMDFSSFNFLSWIDRCKRQSKSKPQSDEENPHVPYTDLSSIGSTEDINSLHEKLNQERTQNENISREKERLKLENEQLSTSKTDLANSLQKELNKERTEKENYSRECDKLGIEKQRLKLENEKLSKSTADLSNRLAKEMGQKVAANEMSVENISIRNRPMNIADEYNLFCSNQWLDAKQAIDNTVDNTVPAAEYVKIQLLHHILLVAYQKADCEIERIHKDNLLPLKQLDNPGELSCKTDHMDTSVQGRPNIGNWSEVSTEVTNFLGDYLRNNADRVQLEQIQQNVFSVLDNNVQTNHQSSDSYMTIWPHVKDQDEIKLYVKSSVKLCWKMVIQRPKMLFAAAEPWRGEQFQELYWGSQVVKEAIVIEVFPQLCHGKQPMSKAKVYLFDPQNLEN